MFFLNKLSISYCCLGIFLNLFVHCFGQVKSVKSQEHVPVQFPEMVLCLEIYDNKYKWRKVKMSVFYMVPSIRSDGTPYSKCIKFQKCEFYGMTVAITRKQCFCKSFFDVADNFIIKFQFQKVLHFFYVLLAVCSAYIV